MLLDRLPYDLLQLAGEAKGNETERTREGKLGGVDRDDDDPVGVAELQVLVVEAPKVEKL